MNLKDFSKVLTNDREVWYTGIVGGGNKTRRMEMTFSEVREYVKRSGVRVYVVAKISKYDEICVEVKKGDFLEQIKGYEGETGIIQILEGDVIFG